MTLQEMSSFIQNALRYKMSTAQVILLIDAVQKIAFDEDQNIFKIWSSFTPQFTLTFSSGGYTSAVAGDVGKTVTDGTATGVLISYDNTARTWNITSSNDTAFTDSAAVTITAGTGAGTLASSSSFVGYKGPYDAPTSPPCRKIWGVTRETDARIYGNDGTITTDYDFSSDFYDPSRLFEQARVDNINSQITLIQAPTLNSVYRWVYWRQAPTITGIDSGDDASMLIPSTYHFQFINACLLQSNIIIRGEMVNPNDVRAILGRWWESLLAPYTPMGKNTALRALSRQGPDVLI